MEARKQTKKVTASNLASMGSCERKILMEAKLGRRTSPSRRHAQAEGTNQHLKFFHEAVRSKSNVAASEAKPWCFVASLVYGADAPETKVLRNFRDRVLRQTRPGRSMIGFYYKKSPAVCRHLRGKRSLIRLFRTILLPLVWCARMALVVDALATRVRK